MVWLSTTTCTSSLPWRRLTPPLLHNMRFSLRWLPSTPWQRRKTLTRLSTSLQTNTCGRSKDACREICPFAAHCGHRPWPCCLRSRPKSAPQNHAESQANTHMLAKCSHHVLDTEFQLFPATCCSLTLGFCRQASITFSDPPFVMKWMVASHSILTLPLLFPFSLFNEAWVQLLAASRLSYKIGCSMVRATVAGALPVNCTTRSRVPFMPHNRPWRTPWRP